MEQISNDAKLLIESKIQDIVTDLLVEHSKCFVLTSIVYWFSVT